MKKNSKRPRNSKDSAKTADHTLDTSGDGDAAEYEMDEVPHELEVSQGPVTLGQLTDQDWAEIAILANTLYRSCKYGEHQGRIWIHALSEWLDAKRLYFQTSDDEEVMRVH